MLRVREAVGEQNGGLLGGGESRVERLREAKDLSVTGLTGA